MAYVLRQAVNAVGRRAKDDDGEQGGELEPAFMDSDATDARARARRVCDDKCVKTVVSNHSHVLLVASPGGVKTIERAAPSVPVKSTVCRGRLMLKKNIGDLIVCEPACRTAADGNYPTRLTNKTGTPHLLLRLRKLSHTA